MFIALMHHSTCGWGKPRHTRRSNEHSPKGGAEMGGQEWHCFQPQKTAAVCFSWAFRFLKWREVKMNGKTVGYEDSKKYVPRSDVSQRRYTMLETANSRTGRKKHKDYESGKCCEWTKVGVQSQTSTLSLYGFVKICRNLWSTSVDCVVS